MVRPVVPPPPLAVREKDDDDEASLGRMNVGGQNVYFKGASEFMIEESKSSNSCSGADHEKKVIFVILNL